jgi:hypothetical protein
MVFSWENRCSSDKLGEDAPYGPHVYFLVVVLLAQNDFRCAVPPRDNVFSQRVCKLGIGIGELLDTPG